MTARSGAVRRPEREWRWTTGRAPPYQASSFAARTAAPTPSQQRRGPAECDLPGPWPNPPKKDPTVPDSTPHTRRPRTHAGDAFAALLRSGSTDLEPVAADLARAGQDVARPHGALLLSDLGCGATVAEPAAVTICTAVHGAIRCPTQPASPAHATVVVPALVPEVWSVAMQAAREVTDSHAVVAVAVAPVTGLDALRSHYRRAVADVAVAAAVLERPQLVERADLVIWRMLADLDDDGQRAALAPLARVLALPPQSRAMLLRTADVMLLRGATYEEAGRRLHVHVNTVRYRLDRFEELTGLKLRDVSTAVRVHLALRLLQLRVDGAPQPAGAR